MLTNHNAYKHFRNGPIVLLIENFYNMKYYFKNKSHTFFCVASWSPMNHKFGQAADYVSSD